MMETSWKHAGKWWKHGGNMVETWWKHGGNMKETWWKHGGTRIEICVRLWDLENWCYECRIRIR